MLGKLPTVDSGTSKNKLKIYDVDCSAAVLESANPDDDFDEILAEILAEEEEARKSKEAEDDEKKRKKQKKQKKKGKKSKKNKDGEFADWEKDEL